MERDDNDLDVDKIFFSTRGKVKTPRKQRRKPIAIDLDETPKKIRGRRGNIYQNTKSGARTDLKGIVARSAWEADVMRVLQLHEIKFQFEPIVFEFPIDARGRMSSYLPDIYLPDTGEFIEVKGYLDPRGRNKLRKFRKHYPEEFSKLWVVISKSSKANKLFFRKLGVRGILYYEHLSVLYKNKIVNWEGKK